MKIFKPIVLICSLFLCISLHGQTNDSLQNVNSKKSILYFSTISSNDQYVSLEDVNVQAEVPPLVLYNRTNNYYDSFLANNGTFEYSGTTTSFKNESNFLMTLFLGNDSFIESNPLLLNRSLLLDQDETYQVRDSFNPHGASNFSEAILGGVLGLLFD